MDMEQPPARTLQVSIGTPRREPSADAVMAGIRLQQAGGVGFLLGCFKESRMRLLETTQ